MLEVINASKTFMNGTCDARAALDGISLSLKDGDFVMVIGSNGAGKSTLFNALSGVLQIDSGQIILGGKNITFMQPHKRAAVIGQLFQDPLKGTAPSLTVEENLAMAYSRSGKHLFGLALGKKDIELFRERLLEFGMGLEDRMRIKVGTLSGGQRQALTLLMCTLVPPKLLLLDEHTAALDPSASEKIMEITNRVVQKYSLTTLMITHNISTALKTGTRIIMMDSGRIILDLSGEERDNMTVIELMDRFNQKSGRALDDDRMLLV